MEGESSTPSGGYTHEFVDTVEEYECTFCLSVARDPQLVVTCGHSFCDTCLRNWIGPKTRNLQCPSDKIGFGRADVVPDRRQERRIRDLRVYCENRTHGCPATPELRDIQAHMETCKYQPSLILKDIEHLKSENCDLNAKLVLLTTKSEGERDAQVKIIDDLNEDLQKSKDKITKREDMIADLSTKNQTARDKIVKLGEKIHHLTSEAKMMSKERDQQTGVIASLETRVTELEEAGNDAKQCKKTEKDGRFDSVSSVQEVRHRVQGCVRDTYDRITDYDQSCQCSWRVNIAKGVNVLKLSAFYTEGGYRMRVNVCWRKGWSHFVVGCSLIRGVNDDRLEWPWRGNEVVVVRDVTNDVIIGECTKADLSAKARERPTLFQGSDWNLFSAKFPCDETEMVIDVVVKMGGAKEVRERGLRIKPEVVEPPRVCECEHPNIQGVNTKPSTGMACLGLVMIVLIYLLGCYFPVDYVHKILINTVDNYFGCDLCKNETVVIVSS